MRFLRHGGIYLVRWGFNCKTKIKTKSKSWVGTIPPPAGRPRSQAKERAGRIALSHRPQMSSDRLFLDRVGRHQSPSPLRRHAQPTTHFPRGTSKPEVSTLLGSGSFYFALTRIKDLVFPVPPRRWIAAAPTILTGLLFLVGALDA